MPTLIAQTEEHLPISPGENDLSAKCARIYERKLRLTFFRNIYESMQWFNRVKRISHLMLDLNRLTYILIGVRKILAWMETNKNA